MLGEGVVASTTIYLTCKLVLHKQTMDSGSYLDQERYKNEFDPKAYLNSMFCNAEVFESELQLLVDFYGQFKKDSLQVLDYAAGPSLLYMLPAIQKASKITMADYLVQNRAELRKWVQQDSSAFDWKPAIKQVMSFGGQNPKEEAIQDLETSMREKIKAIVHCDIAADVIIQNGHEGPYDVVNCTGLLDAVCSTKDLFVDSVRKLASLVKQGGYFIANTDESESYTVAAATFCTPLCISKDDLLEAFSKAGLSIVRSKTFVSFDKSTLVIAQKDHY